MPLFYSYQAYFGHYKVKLYPPVCVHCVMGTESYNGFIFIKSITMFKRMICFEALAIQWSKLVPRKWRGPVISQLYMC